MKIGDANGGRYANMVAVQSRGRKMKVIGVKEDAPDDVKRAYANRDKERRERKQKKEKGSVELLIADMATVENGEIVELHADAGLAEKGIRKTDERTRQGNIGYVNGRCYVRVKDRSPHVQGTLQEGK